MINTEGMEFDGDIQDSDTDVARDSDEININIDEHQYFSFFVSGKIFAINIMNIKEIFSLSKITKVPNTQTTLRGVLNNRGSILPVVDLASRFNIDDDFSYGKKACIIVVELITVEKVYTIGVIVEEINKVLTFLPKDLIEVPSYGTPIRSDFITKIAKIDELFIPLLDLETTLEIEELSTRLESTEKVEYE